MASFHGLKRAEQEKVSDTSSDSIVLHPPAEASSAMVWSMRILSSSTGTAYRVKLSGLSLTRDG